MFHGLRQDEACALRLEDLELSQSRTSDTRSMKRRLTILLAVTGICRILSGCGEIEQATGTGPKGYPYQIATTVAMISDIVRQVAGQHAVVEGVVGEGVDPHLYAASINDVKAFYAADVIFYNGLMLEGKMSDVLVRVGRKKPVHAVTEAIRQETDGSNPQRRRRGLRKILEQRRRRGGDR